MKEKVGKGYLPSDSASFSLPKEEEINLSKIIQAGLREGASEEEVASSNGAALILASAHAQKAREVAYHDFYYLDEATKEDLAQEGFLALIELAKTFDPEKGARFSTYVHLPLRKAYQNYLKKNNLLRLEEPESLPAPTDEGDKREQKRTEKAIKALSGAFVFLTCRQKEAIGYRFGLFGYPLLQTYRRIGEKMGISEEAARRLVIRGLGKIENHMGGKA